MSKVLRLHFFGSSVKWVMTTYNRQRQIYRGRNTQKRKRKAVESCHLCHWAQWQKIMWQERNRPRAIVFFFSGAPPLPLLPFEVLEGASCPESWMNHLLMSRRSVNHLAHQRAPYNNGGGGGFLKAMTIVPRFMRRRHRGRESVEIIIKKRQLSKWNVKGKKGDIIVILDCFDRATARLPRLYGMSLKIPNQDLSRRPMSSHATLTFSHQYGIIL